MSVDHIETEKDALTKDAAAWDCLATAQRRLANAVSGLTLRVEDLNPRAESKESAHAEYRTFIGELEQTLDQGARVVADASQALIDVRNAYAENEQAADDLAQQMLQELEARSGQ